MKTKGRVSNNLRVHSISINDCAAIPAPCPFLSSKKTWISVADDCDSYQAKCGSTDPCAHIAAGVPASIHKASQERGNVQ